MNEKSGRGGKREWAGRKPLPPALVTRLALALRKRDADHPLPKEALRYLGRLGGGEGTPKRGSICTQP